ncbi:hypothetical protein ACWF94_34700, partial [Streptomyces sp. NPDC055078]
MTRTAPADTGTHAGTGTAADTGTDTRTESSADAGTDTRTETGTDTATASVTGAESENGPAAVLLERLAGLRDRAALLVDHRSADDPTAADPLRGLYLSPEHVRRLLSPAQPPPLPRTGGTGGTGQPHDRLARIAGRLGLTGLDTDLLLIAIAPELDRGFESLYGYLNDDVSRRRATIALALDLCGVPVHLTGARARLHPTAPLRALGLLTLEEPERPFLSRSLRVPDRVVAHLLGDDTPDAALAGHLRPLIPPHEPHEPYEPHEPHEPHEPFDNEGDRADEGDEGSEGDKGPEREGEFTFDGFARRLAARLTASPPPTVYLR